MKYFVKAAEFVIVIALLVLSILTFNKINQIELIKADDYSPDQYHIAIVTDDVNSYAFEKFIDGVEVSMEAQQSIYEIYEVGDISLEDVVEMIIITEVDGVVLRLSDNTIANDAITKLDQADIRVIAVGNDAPESPRDVYIGTNKFNMGRHAANLAIKAIGNEGHVGIILGSEYINETAIATNNFVNGIQDIITKSSNIELTTIKYTHSIRAELLMDDILDENLPIDVVICTDPVDVNRIIRVLVDRNRVGEIKIIASGDTAEIIDGIEKRLISVSIVEDYTELGALSITYLHQVLNGEGASVYVNVPFNTIHQSNLGVE